MLPLDAARLASLHLVGHGAELAAFEAALASGRLHHAWLLTGSEGIGKAALAFRMARVLLNAVDGTSPAGHLVTAGTHPDLLAVGRGFDEKRQRLRGEIVADEIRPIGAFMHRTAAEGGWRVVIIDTAETMNRNAANALLKILEEPPPRALLLLTSATPGLLLPTIRSRVRKLPVLPLTDEEVRTVLRQRAPDTSTGEIERVVALAEGSPGRAMALLADRDGALAAVAAEAVAGMPMQRQMEVAAEIARVEAAFGLFFGLLASALADVAKKSASRELGRAKKLVDSWEQVRRIERETLRFNLDRQEAVIEALAVAGQSAGI